jgi:hypothetical protein
MNTTSVEEIKGQCPLTFYLYHGNYYILFATQAISMVMA